MPKPAFRNPDKFQLLPFREWCREHLPPGNEGIVIEDLDLLVRHFGAEHGTDAIGRFMLCELKFDTSMIGTAQRRTFGLLDGLLRAGDKDGDRYLGYYIINYDNEDWNRANFRVNGQVLIHEKFWGFLMGLYEIPAFKF